MDVAAPPLPPPPVEHIFYDSLPPTSEDYRLDFAGYHGVPSWCRVRVYRPNGMPPVLVATDPYEVEDSGTSITNLAELVFRLAWSRAGEPWPAVFIEHYAGDRKASDESWDFVIFPQASAGSPPALREDFNTGSITIIEETPIGGEETDTTIHRSVSLDIAFGKASWKYGDRAAIEAAIGQPMSPRPISVVVERIHRSVNRGAPSPPSIQS